MQGARVRPGRLCGAIVRAEGQALRGAQVFANYLLSFRDLSGEGIPAQGVVGTLEGVVAQLRLWVSSSTITLACEPAARRRG